MIKKITPLVKNMRALRQARHISASDMAAYLGKAVSTYRNYEMGFFPMPEEYIPLVAGRLGVTPAQLTGEEPLPGGEEAPSAQEETLKEEAPAPKSPGPRRMTWREKKEREKRAQGEEEKRKPWGEPRGHAPGQETTPAREETDEEDGEESSRYRDFFAWREQRRKAQEAREADKSQMPRGSLRVAEQKAKKEAPKAPEADPRMTKIEGTGTLFDEFVLLQLEPRCVSFERVQEGDEETEAFFEEGAAQTPEVMEPSVPVEDLFAYAQLLPGAVMSPDYPSPEGALGLGLSAFEKAAALLREKKTGRKPAERKDTLRAEPRQAEAEAEPVPEEVLPAEPEREEPAREKPRKWSSGKWEEFTPGRRGKTTESPIPLRTSDDPRDTRGQLAFDFSAQNTEPPLAEEEPAAPVPAEPLPAAQELPTDAVREEPPAEQVTEEQVMEEILPEEAPAEKTPAPERKKKRVVSRLRRKDPSANRPEAEEIPSVPTPEPRSEAAQEPRPEETEKPSPEAAQKPRPEEAQKPLPEKIEGEKKAPQAFRPRFVIQNSRGDSVELKAVAARVKKDAPGSEAVYIKPGENKAYWTDSRNSGFVLLWE